MKEKVCTQIKQTTGHSLPLYIVLA